MTSLRVRGRPSAMPAWPAPEPETALEDPGPRKLPPTAPSAPDRPFWPKAPPDAEAVGAPPECSRTPSIGAACSSAIATAPCSPAPPRMPPLATRRYPSTGHWPSMRHRSLAPNSPSLAFPHLPSLASRRLPLPSVAFPRLPSPPLAFSRLPSPFPLSYPLQPRLGT